MENNDAPKHDDLMKKAEEPNAASLLTPTTTEPAPAAVESAPTSEKPKAKSPLLPILLGVLVLLAIAGIGAYFFLTRKPVKPKTDIQLPIPVQPSATPVPLFLTLSSPTAATKAINGEILVSGTTLPLTTVMIVTDSDETSLESDSDGLFESSVLIGEKGGLLKVTVYSSAGEEKSETLSITGGSS
jgi:hypothetical protein